MLTSPGWSNYSVKFYSLDFEQCIRENLGMFDNEEIRINDLALIEELIREDPIDNFADVKYLFDLTIINI